MSINEMTSKVRELKELQALIEEAEAEAEEIKDQIKKAMPELAQQFTKQTESRRFTVA